MNRGQMPSFLAEMLSGAENGQGLQSPVYPIPEAQRDELALMVASYGPPAIRPFQRGDFVVYQHGHGPLTQDARENLTLVFWRYLDLTDAAGLDFRRVKRLATMSRGAHSRVDCLIGYLNPGSNTLVFDVTDSHALALAPTP